MTKETKKSGQLKGFMRGVFWTTYIGMAVYIGLPYMPERATDKAEGYKVADRSVVTTLFAPASVEDLEGTLDDNDGRK